VTQHEPASAMILAYVEVHIIPTRPGIVMISEGNSLDTLTQNIINGEKLLIAGVCFEITPVVVVQVDQRIYSAPGASNPMIYDWCAVVLKINAGTLHPPSGARYLLWLLLQQSILLRQYLPLHAGSNKNRRSAVL